MPKKFDGSEIEGLICFDRSEMYLQSESLSETYGAVKLIYEHCIELNPTGEGCADQNTTEQFWSEVMIFLQFDFLRVDMELESDPLQDFRKFFLLNTEFNIE